MAGNQKWVVTISPFANPKLGSKKFLGSPERYQNYIDVWEKYIAPIDPEGEGDWEDFFEQAARLDAAINSFGVENIYLKTSSYDFYTYLADGSKITSDELPADAKYYGIVYSYNSFFHPERGRDHKVDRYAWLETFQANAGRKISVAGFNAEKGKDILKEMVAFSQMGIKEVYLKTIQAKKGLWVFTLPENLDEKQAIELLRDVMDWGLITAEGLNNGLILQEKIVMEYEYRMFIINNEVVTSAGCVEEYTPLDNEAVFDFKVRLNRQAVSPVEAAVSLVERLRVFGQEMAQKLSEEQPELSDYVLDAALGSDGEPLIIELNPLSNLGLYACEPQKITDALNQK